MIVAVLCTGPSLTQADVHYCRGRCKVVAVSDAIYMAPWADALVSYDKKWWRAHKPDYAGPKYHCHFEKVEGVEAFEPRPGNSGTLGVVVAEKLWKPEKILLLGADLKGTHFFGPHTKKDLRNTSVLQFETMKKQFAKLKKLPVVNCSPDSALTCFRKGVLREELADVLQRSAA
jgi:hypothetical protein